RHRNRCSRIRDAAIGAEALQRESALSVADIRGKPIGLQLHALRHVLQPAVHRTAKNPEGDSAAPEMRGYREAIGARTDNCCVDHRLGETAPFENSMRRRACMPFRGLPAFMANLVPGRRRLVRRSCRQASGLVAPATPLYKPFQIRESLTINLSGPEREARISPHTSAAHLQKC